MTSDATPFTLRSAAGLGTEPPDLATTTLVVIDAQQEYSSTGRLPLPGVDSAVERIATLIAESRRVGGHVVHVHHRGSPGGLFDPAEGGRLLAAAQPRPTEVVIGKTLPNSFAGTDLQRSLNEIGATDLVLVGFMTHMCVSSTARAALDLGYRSTVVSDATATRSLPTSDGAPLPAAVLQRAALAALGDRFSVVTDTEAILTAAGVLVR